MLTQKSTETFLLEKKYFSKEKLNELITEARKKQQSLLFYLANHHLLSPHDIVEIGSQIFGVSEINLRKIHIRDLPQEGIPLNLIRETKAIPIQKAKHHITLAMIDPSETHIIERFQFQTGCPVKPFVAKYDDIEKLIHQLSSHNYLSSLDKLKTNEKQNIVVSEQNDEEPIIRFVNALFEDALKQKASDIHIEILETKCRIRFRKDGLLYEINYPPKHTANRIVARIKIMANLDIAEKRFPQDGRIKKGNLDIRINTCPTLFGEKIVLRLLNQDTTHRKIHELNFLPQQEKLFIQAIEKPQGLILVTGPTGSGKTNTLYAALSHLNQPEKNILTVEDPVEIILPGINQVNIHEKIGLSFAKILRAFLRQDPDIIMVGEIRDSETAEIAIRAAETGHLVLSTLHTNSATEAISRLENLGISRYDVAHCVNLITAQRLARKCCPHCSQGCDLCTNGFSGRIAIHEILEINESLKNQIIEKKSNFQLNGFISLFDAGLHQVQQGKTTREEIKRVLGSS